LVRGARQAGAPGKPFKEISTYLTEGHGLSKWWAQKLIVEYEQDRGIRKPGARANGTFQISTSRTVDVPVELLQRAFTDARCRRGWLGPRVKLTSSAPRKVRFDWDDGTSRVTAAFIDKGPTKSAVLLTHDRLTDARKSQQLKASWREQLEELKGSLEAKASAN
jgi:hypothetical protein